MTREHVGKVFDVVCSFETWSEESSKRTDKRGKKAKYDAVKLCGHTVNFDTSERTQRNLDKLFDKYGVNIFASVVLKNSNVISERSTNPEISSVSLKHVVAEVPRSKYIEDHASYETFKCLVRTQFYQFCSSESLSCKVSRNVVESDTLLREKVPKSSVSWSHWQRCCAYCTIQSHNTSVIHLT
jgi:hypothetical protein